MKRKQRQRALDALAPMLNAAAKENARGTRPATDAEVRKDALELLDRLIGPVLAHKPAARTKKAKKRQRRRRKVQRESSI
jgi:hypothetical protein